MHQNTMSLPSSCPMTPSDTQDTLLNGAVFISRAVCIAVAGAYKFTFADETTNTLTLPVGVTYLAVRRLWATPAPAGAGVIALA